MREYGLTVEFNGDHYVVRTESIIKEYRIGEMACEILRFRSIELKEALAQAEFLHESLNKDQMKKILDWLRCYLESKYPCLIADMLAIMFYNKCDDYFSSDENQKEEWLNLYRKIDDKDLIEDFLMQDTDYEGFGNKTNGQFLYSLGVLISYEWHFFRALFLWYLRADEDSEAGAQALIRMLSDDDILEMQDIQYGIAIYNGRINSLYTIKTLFSLLFFEVAHIMEKNVSIVECKNCGNYFVPLKRTDTKYCNYPAPDCPEKTCKEIGAQKAWADKERVDDVTQAYRKVYMRYKMRANRHPEDTEAQVRMEQLSEGIKTWRRKLASGEAEKDAFMQWLEVF